MTILVTGFTGKVGFEVAEKLKKLPMKCGVRNVEKVKADHGEDYEFVSLDFSSPETFDRALEGIDIRIFVPAGKGKTSFVDARDIAEIAAIALSDIEKYKNKSYVITGD